MLPLGIRQCFLLGQNPLIGCLFATAGTKAALATEADFFLVTTIRIATAMSGVAHDLKPAAQHFDDVFNDGVAERVSMFGKITPPRLVSLKQLFNGADGANDASMQWWKRRMGTLAKALRIGNMAT